MMTRLSLLLIGVLAAGPLPAPGLDRSPLLPPDALVTVRVSDVPRFSAAIGQSSLGRLWNDPQVQDFLGRPELGAWAKERLCGPGDTEAAHLQWEEFKMLKGELLVAFDAEHDPPHLVAALAPEEYQRSLDMDRRIHELTDDEKETMNRVPFQGLELVQYVVETSDGEPQVNWQAHTAGTLVASPSRGWVEQTVVALARGGVKEPEGPPELNVSVNLAGLIDLGLRKFEEAQAKTAAPGPGAQPAAPTFPAPSARKVAEALGLLSLKRLNLDLVLRDDEMSVDLRIGMDGPPRGIFRILDARPSTLDLAVPFVPENAFAYKVSRVDLLALWQAVPEILQQAFPEQVAQVQAGLAGLTGALGLDLGKDFLAHLDTQYVSFSSVSGVAPVSVTAVRLRDESAVASAIAKILSETAAPGMMFGPSLKREPFLGFPFYRLETQDPAASQALAAAGGYLFYGTDSGVRDALRTLSAPEQPGSPFYQSALLGEMRRRVPADAFGYSLVNWGSLVKATLSDRYRSQVLEWLEKVSQPAPDSGNASAPPALWSRVDFSKLPPAGHLASFFGPSFMFSRLADGVLQSSAVLRYQPR